ncbi:MAG TPA: hypothetical protein VN044_07455, partial [Verrucomicrobiae bacterium]|nr:hypothetical protein [Verrucomicrobiae bacterium]
MTVLYLGIFIFALILSFILTRSIRNAATAHGWVYPPALERHLHAAPIPRLGGIAIFGAFALSLAVALVISSLRPELQFGSSLRILTTILLPG